MDKTQARKAPSEVTYNLMEQAKELRLEAYGQVQSMFDDDCCHTKLTFELLNNAILPEFGISLSEGIFRYAFALKQRMDIYSKLSLTIPSYFLPFLTILVLL